MEEPPLVSDWQKLTNTTNVVVVPFFISDGLYSYEDIPVLLGITKKRSTRLRSPERPTARQAITSRAARGEVFRRNPYKIDGRALFYAPSIGTDPGFADIIIEQAAKFDSEGSRRGGTS
jgi:sirohydrochlorin cobaltochelatase